MTIRSMPTQIPDDKWNAIKWEHHEDNPYSSRNVKRKENVTARIISDSYRGKSFVTANIDGVPREIESRSQERRLMRQAGCIKREAGMKKDDKRIRYKENYKIDTKGVSGQWV